MANGDESIILSSGFNTTKQPATTQKAELTVTSGTKSGSGKMKSKAVDKAGSYIWQPAKGSLSTSESGWINIGYSTQQTLKSEDWIWLPFVISEGQL